MKRAKYVLIVLFFLLFIQTSVTAKNPSYDIESYNVEISVDKDLNYTYNENINLVFNKSNTIVTKTIPYEATDININKNYVIETNKDKLIKISSKNNTHDSYTYKYKIKKDKENDDIYIIEIDNNFNNDISKLDFILTYPSSFNKNNLTFYLNGKKVKDITYKINNQELTGSISNLKEDDKLLVIVDYGKIYVNSLTIITIVISILLSLFSYILWRIYGKDVKYTIEFEKNIPSKLNTIDVSLIEKGYLNNENAIYLLLDLANRGYLKISEEENNEFTITRIKYYDGSNYKEASFIRALFRKNMTVNISEYIEALNKESKTPYQKELDKKITKDNIKYRLIRAIKNVMSISKSNEEKNKYFETKSNNKKTYLLFSITIILVLITSIPFIEINKLYLLPISVLFSSISLFILINIVENVDLKKKNNKITILLLFAIIALIVLLTPSFKQNRIYFIAFLIGIMAVTFILFLYKYMPKRTIHGTRLYSKIEGLKKYLNEVSDKELKLVLKDNPNYLYDILPYSYILGIESVVFNKLKKLNIEEPKWYKIDNFTYRKLFNSINRLINLVNEEDKE